MEKASVRFAGQIAPIRGAVSFGGKEGSLWRVVLEGGAESLPQGWALSAMTNRLLDIVISETAPVRHGTRDGNDGDDE